MIVPQQTEVGGYAGVALRAALATLVVTDQVISLPVMRAGAMLDRAQELLEEEASHETDSQERVAELVDGARDQIEMARLLGYGEEGDYARFEEQIPHRLCNEGDEALVGLRVDAFLLS